MAKSSRIRTVGRVYSRTAGAPGAVGVAAGEVGQDPAGLGEADLAAAAGDEVPEGLGDMGLADADRPVEDDRFAGVQPAQRGQVADLRGGDLRVGGEVLADILETHPGKTQPAASRLASASRADS